MPRHVVVDVETAQSYDHVIEIAAVEIIGDALTQRRFVCRVKPRSPMNPFCYAVHGISLEELRNQPYFEQVVPELIDFIGGDIIVAHNSAYEYNIQVGSIGKMRSGYRLKKAKEFLSYRLNAGDLVIAMDRPLISSGLKAAVVREEDEGCLLVQRVARYVAGEFLEPLFAWHLINSNIFIDHAVSRATGSDLPHISSNDILATPLPLPPLNEQREIVRRIESAFAWVDRLASEATSARKLIDRLDQATLSKAFRGELVPQDPNDEPASVLLERIRAEKRNGANERGRGRRRSRNAAGP